MKKILFVDEDPRVLDGLRRTLRGMRQDWEMEFAAGGREALSILAARPFDVVIADMRMSGLDGYQLLDCVKKLHPEVVRIAFAPSTDKKTIAKANGLAHQYLAKPCEPETLKSAINRACVLGGLLENPDLVRVISGIDSLPVLPPLYSEIMQELTSPEGSMRRVSEIISRDVAMSVKILQLVNSGFFGLPVHVSKVSRAVSLLGMETVKALVLSLKVFSQFELSRLPVHRTAELRRHSSGTGMIAKKIAAELSLGQLKSDAFMAGLLHDVGRLILLEKLPEESGNVERIAASERCASWEAERQVMGFTHEEIGAYMLGMWGLSESVVEAVAFHHTPSKCGNRGIGVLTAVHLADAFHHSSYSCSWKSRLDLDYLEELGLVEMIEDLRLTGD